MDNFFETGSSELGSHLTKRGYKRRFIKEQITRAKQVPRNEALKENKPATKHTTVPIPFTVTYNPALPNIHDIFRLKQSILQSTEHLSNNKSADWNIAHHACAYNCSASAPNVVIFQPFSIETYGWKITAFTLYYAYATIPSKTS